MNIGEAGRLSKVSVKMIRHYESIGLLPAAIRTESGYRVYDHDDVHILRFIRNARDLGFSLAEIRDLIGLWQDKSRASAEVKRLALAHVSAIEDKARALQVMADTLRHLADACHGDERPDCPILEGLSEGNVLESSVHCHGGAAPSEPTRLAAQPKNRERRRSGKEV